MLLRFLLSVLLLSFVSRTFAADYVSVETAAGVHWMTGGVASTLRVRHEMGNLPLLYDQPGYIEALAVRWNTENANSGWGFVAGIQPQSDEHWHYILGLGGVHLTDRTELSGTHNEFTVRLGRGYTIGNMDYSLVYTHYSNARPVFHEHGPNSGYDFVSFQLSYAFN
jgi:hypothetical protein